MGGLEELFVQMIVELPSVGGMAYALFKVSQCLSMTVEALERVCLSTDCNRQAVGEDDQV